MYSQLDKLRSNRNPVFDVMKGIGIIAVIIGHIGIIEYMPWRQFCFSFHMPLFFLLAGYFYKINKNIKQDFKKSAKRLLIPYGFTAFVLGIHMLLRILAGKQEWNAILEFFVSVLYASGSKHHSIYFANIMSIEAIWFLAALFWCKTIYNWINFQFKYSTALVCLVAVVATCVDYYVVNLPFAILPGLSAMIFFAIGNYVSLHKIPKWLFVLSILSYPISFAYCRIFMVQCHYDIYPLAILGSCGGVFLIYITTVQ